MPLEDLELEDQPGTGDAAPGPAQTLTDGKAAGVDKGKGDRAERDEVARLRQELKETKASERYWADRAARASDGDGEGEGSAGGDAEPAEDLSALQELLDKYKDTPGGDEMSAEDFVDEISKAGPKAVEKLVQKLGYVRKQDVAKIAAEIARDIARREVRSEVTRQTHDSALVRDFPGLKDESSELFKETGKIFREAVAKDPRLRQSPVALMMAAQAAQEKIKARDGAGRRRTADQDTGYDYREDDERERNRRQRVRSQQGDTGRGTPGAHEDDGDDQLGPQARHLVSMFGLKEEDYRKERRAKRE